MICLNFFPRLHTDESRSADISKIMDTLRAIRNVPDYLELGDVKERPVEYEKGVTAFQMRAQFY